MCAEPSTAKEAATDGIRRLRSLHPSVMPLAHQKAFVLLPLLAVLHVAPADYWPIKPLSRAHLLTSMPKLNDLTVCVEPEPGTSPLQN